MNLFRDEKDKKVIQLLKDSKQDFTFDEINIKARLFMAMDAPLPKKDKVILQRHHFMPKYAAGLMFSMLLLVTTAGVSFASNRAKPGERLFEVQKLQNNLVLSLPLPNTQKAQYRTDIVAQRLGELDRIELPTANPIQIAAEIQASEQSIDDAVSNISTIQDQAKDNHVKILSLLKELDELSDKHEKKMASIRENVTDDKIRAEIDRSLKAIKLNREKLHKAQTENSADVLKITE